MVHENYSIREWKPATVPRPHRAPCTVRDLEHQIPRIVKMSLWGDATSEMFQGNGSRTSFNLKKNRRAGFSMTVKRQEEGMCLSTGAKEKKNLAVSFCLWVDFLKSMPTPVLHLLSP